MRDQRPFTSLAARLSGAVAVSRDDVILYANEPFQNFYGPLSDEDKKRFRSILVNLSNGLQTSGQIFAREKMELFPEKERIEIIVYLVNEHHSKEKHLLFVACPRESYLQLPAAGFEIPSRLDRNSASSNAELIPEFMDLVGEDLCFKGALLKAQKSAQTDFPVLILGESGTGKEIIARTIHKTSYRKNKKFVDINCAAIPDQLIDSELFGYEKGAFTGASSSGRHGLFFDANQGTLFLDEIAEASLQTQAKLLRVLNEGSFKRVGSTKNIKVDVRIIAATNKDLSQMIEENRFRQDLLFRMNTITIHVPPLRERVKDIPLLANFFLSEHSKQQKRRLQITPSCLELMKGYSWPGNVRELKGVVDYMVTMAASPLLTEKSLPDFLMPPGQDVIENEFPQQEGPDDHQDIGILPLAIQNTEIEVIKNVLQQSKNKSEAIKLLGISRRTFYSKLKQYNLE